MKSSGDHISTRLEYLASYNGPEIKIMEVCGTHTAAIFKSGIRSIISKKIKLISGPGCPVCVTPTSYIDKCIEYALRQNHILVSFGDMLKVPGSKYSLAESKGLGASIEMVYSPFDILKTAKENPDNAYIVVAVGFETTAPVFALFVQELIRSKIENVRLLTALKSAIPAINWVCESEEDIDGFLCPGHVAVVIGENPFSNLLNKFNKPFVIGGFEERHIVHAIYEIVNQIEENNPSVCNLYPEAVKVDGNRKADEQISKFFSREKTMWRGLGFIPDSGFYLTKGFERYDAGSLGLWQDGNLPDGCRCADVITGRADPVDCPMFGNGCEPTSPYGPCMVSAEGACGIWYQNR